jgi:cell shape-determining protein MreC
MIITLIATVISVLKQDGWDVIFGTLFLTSVVIFCILLGFVINGRTIDSKLEMYNEENIQIETKVKETVRAYMNFEEETYKELVKDAELEFLVIKYPELNSNELVKKEIEIYTENNAKIKELKEEKINLSIKKWWLYFGK